MNSLPVWYTIGTISAILPLLLIKKYILNKETVNIIPAEVFLVLALFCYLVLMFSYIKIFSKNKVSTSYTLIQLLQILIVIFVGILFFKEKLSKNQILGIILAMISIHFLT